MKTPKPKPNQKQCFSYIRWSSAKQSDGNSEDRQLEVAPRVADEKGWFLREDLNIKADGVSSWKGTNKATLQKIVDAANEGKIPQGIVMIIEALDRASRFTIDEGYQIIREIILSGVEIYNDRTKRHLTKESLNNMLHIMEVLFELNSAFQYSDVLSDRVGKAWRAKRAEMYKGVKLTEKSVGWIDGTTWKPIPEAVKTVKKIFNMYLDGIGISSIARHLNETNTPVLGRAKTGWGTGYLWAMLHSRAVIGEFQSYKSIVIKGQKSYGREPIGEPIPDYYPRIIDDATFYAVQAKFGTKTEKRLVNREGIGNLFQGVAFCACGAKMYLASSHKGAINNRYYMCWSKLRKTGCNAPTVPYEPIENMFLTVIVKNAERLFASTKVEENTRLIELRGIVGDLKHKITRITDLVVGGKGSKALVEAQSKFEDELEQANGELRIEESMATNKVQRAPKVNDFLTVTTQQLAENQNVRRKARDFITSNVAIMEFSLDRVDVRIGFKNAEHADMMTQELESIRQPKDMGKGTVRQQVKKYMAGQKQPVAA